MGESRTKASKITANCEEFSKVQESERPTDEGGSLNCLQK